MYVDKFTPASIPKKNSTKTCLTWSRDAEERLWRLNSAKQAVAKVNGVPSVMLCLETQNYSSSQVQTWKITCSFLSPQLHRRRSWNPSPLRAEGTRRAASLLTVPANVLILTSPSSPTPSAERQSVPSCCTYDPRCVFLAVRSGIERWIATHSLVLLPALLMRDNSYLNPSAKGSAALPAMV